MNLKSSIFQNTLRFTAIFLTMAGISLYAVHGLRPLLALPLLLLIMQMYSLIRYNDKTNRDLTRLFAAMHHHDFSESFSDGFRGGTYRPLSDELNRIMVTIRDARGRNEAQLQYLNTLIQQAGTGFISVRENGAVDLINTAAKKMLGIGDCRNITHLSGEARSLAALLNQDGTKRTIILGGRDAGSQIAASSVKFRKESRVYTLISLHDIGNELERERLSKELEIARQVQLNLSPRTTPRYPGLQVEGFCAPAKEVGGDYYDFISWNRNRLGIVIGDVSGKGVPAAFYTTLTKGMIQSLAKNQTDLSSLLITLNELLYEYMEPHMFLTLFLLDFSCETREIKAFSAGHNPAVYYCAETDSLSLINPSGIALGLHGGSTFETSSRMLAMTMNRGDIIILYTDGFTEAMNRYQEPFGEERLLAAIRDRTDCSLQNLIERVHRDVTQFTEGRPQNDDMTMVALKAV